MSSWLGRAALSVFFAFVLAMGVYFALVDPHSLGSPAWAQTQAVEDETKPDAEGSAGGEEGAADGEDDDVLEAGQPDDEVGAEEEREREQTRCSSQSERRRLDFRQEAEKAQRQKEGRHHGIGKEANDPFRPIRFCRHHGGARGIELFE